MNYASSVLISNFKAGTGLQGLTAEFWSPGFLNHLIDPWFCVPLLEVSDHALVLFWYACLDPILNFYHCIKSARIQSYSGPNTGRCGPEQLRIWDTFYAVYISRVTWFMQIWIHIRKQKWQLKACAKSFRSFKKRK